MDLVIKTHTSVSEIGESEWNGLVGEGSPFLEYGFLRTLEETDCVGGRSGWHTSLVTVRTSEDDRLLGALPLYVKMHSRGEFVYDWGWADAASRAGIAYYPKGVVAVPLTPVTGVRLLVAPDAPDPAEARGMLVVAGIEVARAAGLSGLHFNFITPDEVPIFEGLDLPIRTQLQYHWYNGRQHGDERYTDFDDFLAGFRSKLRANIRRERRKLAAAGVTTRVVQGDDLDNRQMRRMFRYYLDTIHKYYWGQQYLNEDFFVAIAHNLRDRLHLVVAEQDGREFGGAFNLVRGGRLYGRYWGCVEEVEFTHFEVCMYRPIEWSIQQGLDVFEPGHGGEHKYDRGFEPTTTYSAHWFADPQLDRAIRDFVADERREVERRRLRMQADSPYK